MTLITLFLVTALKAGFANSNCPEWLQSRGSADIPKCTRGNSITMVPEHFPVAAVVVSDRGMRGQSPNFTADFVTKVLQGAGAQTPMILLPVAPETLSFIYKKIDDMADVSDEQKKRWKSNLIHVPAAQGFTWQQDYMQPYIDSRTGQVILREVSNYGRHGDTFDKIIEASRACGFIRGKSLQAEARIGGVGGGNIEILPGGICMLGDDSFQDSATYNRYADQVCGKNPNDRITTPTHWLSVGHTDEIIKVVRNNKAAPPCNFSIAISSPRKALELLRSNPSQPLFDFPQNMNETRSQTIDRRLVEVGAFQNLCQVVQSARDRQSQPGNQRRPRGISRISESKSNRSPASHATAHDCRNLTNDDLLLAFDMDDNLRSYNQLIQKHMDDLKTEVHKKIIRKMPSCQVDIFETPDLFSGGQVIQGPKGPELPKSMGTSFFPNSTNSVSINNTIIAPDPGNSVFRNYLQQQYQERHLKPSFVDTIDYAHRGYGNLHCATNTIHICRP